MAEEIDNLFTNGAAPPTLADPAAAAAAAAADKQAADAAAKAASEQQAKAVADQAAATKAAAEGVKPPSGYVPIQALDEERNKRRDLEGKVDRMNNRFAETMAILASRQGQQPAADPNAGLPDFKTKPADHLAARLERTERVIGQLTGAMQGVGTESNIQTALTGAEVAFKRTAPDYEAALQYYRDMRTTMLIDDNAMEPARAQELARMEERALAVEALQKGRNPAEAFYKMAQRLGYRPPAQAAPAAAADAAAATDKLKKAAAGIEAAKTLSAVTGAADDSQLSLEALSNLEGDQFLAAFNRMVASQAGRGNEVDALFPSRKR